MKYKNTSKKPKFFKVKNDWVSVLPGEEFNTEVQNLDERDSSMLKVETPIFEVEQDYNIPEVQAEETVKPKSEEEIKKMTKDGINDHAALLGYKELDTNMLKSEMVKKLVGYIDENY